MAGQGQVDEGSLAAREAGHHSVGAGACQGNLVCLRDVGSYHWLSLTVQLEEDVPGSVETSTVPLLGLDDAGLAGLSSLGLDGDDNLILLLKMKTLSSTSY